MQIEKFLKHLETTRGYSQHTIKAYKTDLYALNSYLAKNKQSGIESTNQKTLRNWIRHLSQTGINPKSINRKIATLKTFYSHLKKQKTITTNPAENLSNLKTEKMLPDFVKEKDLNKLLTQNQFENNFEGYRDKLIIEMLYTTGIRRAEMVTLKLKDIDTNKQQITVKGKRNKQRIIPYPKSLNQLINQYIALRKTQNPVDTSFFTTSKGNPIYPNLIYRTVKKHLSTITTLKKKTPHTLRHTYATHLLNKGADINAVKELLGHSTLNATQIYTHTTFKQMTQIYNQTHPRTKKQ